MLHAAPTLSRPAVLALTALTMAAFAANSVLCRLALQTTAIDPATFTAIRLATGALTLWLVVRLRARSAPGGSWTSAAVMFVYAIAFSFAYVSLTTGTGALIMFGAVQLTMMGWGLVRGERFTGWQQVGLVAALGGLVYLVLPGLEAPPLSAALLMAASGVAWGVYSLRGRGSRSPAADSAGNFARAVPLALGASVLVVAWPGAAAQWDGIGLAYASISGSVTSGLGYVVWYTVLPALRATSAATVQLSVPVLAALGGVALIGEAITLRLALASLLTLGGIALVLRSGEGRGQKRRAAPSPELPLEVGASERGPREART